ncbi:MAG: SusF/SusE family outer membrane protein [Flavobacteriaceae bacterium]|nr:SusF/SusE family outer membrane protein [Flavobacteriaceae bacterium]
MKRIYKIFILTFFITGLISCDKNENFSIEQPQTGFFIETPSSGSSLILDRTSPENQALAVTWEDTVNQDVSYTLEVAKTATDFAESFSTTSTTSKNYTWSVEELNTFLVNTVRLPQSEESTIDLRVVASNGEISNTITLSVTPFIIEVSELFVNGTFTSWNPTLAVAMNSSEFNIFTINIDLADGDEFNFIPNNTTDEVVWQLVDATSNEVTKFGGVNVSGYSAGNYDITVDLNNNTFTIVEITFPEALFLVGAGVPDAGWGWGSPVEMVLTSVDVFQVETNLINDTFRFFTVNGDWGSGLNYPSFIADGYTIDANFEDALDGDNNFRFIGTPGVYSITVDGTNKTITAVEIIQSLRIAVPGNHQGWDPTTAPQLEASSAATTDYEGYVWLDGEHKFVGPDGSGNFAWGNIDWGDASGTNGSYTQVLTETGEGNIGAPSGAGHYFIQADTDALTYSETMYIWGVIGDATPGGWGSDQDMTYDAGAGVWTITLDLTVGQLKFRANDDWTWNYGDTGADGSLENNGDNMVINTAGNYTIILDLSTPRAYTYSITLN